MAMSVATWLSLAVWAQALGGGATPDGGPTAAASCPRLERSDLTPDPGPSTPSSSMHPVLKVLYEDLLRANTTASMLVTTNYAGAPEYAVSVGKARPSARPTVTVRRYRENLWVATMRWIEGQPALRSNLPQWAEAERAFLATRQRKVETAAATIDDEALAAIGHVWSRMIARARPDGPSKVIVRDADGYRFQDREHSAIASGRAEGTSADQLITIGKLLASYPAVPALQRRPLRDGILAAVVRLEANLDELARCEQAAPHPRGQP
jgi:hypothetical protein